MRRILLFLFPVFLIAASTPATFYSPESLAAELQQLDETIQQGANAKIELPPTWEVETRGRRYTISTAPLQEVLDNREQAGLWLNHLASELSVTGALRGSPSAAQRLEQILSRHEFARKPPPGPLARLWQQFQNWFADLLRSIFAPVFANPSTGRILIWTLALAAAAYILFWFWRRYRRRETELDLSLQPPLPVLETSEWLREAKEAARRGDLRGAIHASYWAGITHLQSRRILPGDFTRTPREYLRCVSRVESSYKPLAALTSGLERFWYAGRPVEPRDFEEALTHLDALGCARHAGRAE